jgi:PhnB protein
MKLITYLTFGGQCEEALNFYKNAFGGEILYLSRMGDSPMEIEEKLKNKIMHARFQFGENVLYMSDTFDPSSLKLGNNVSLSIDSPDPVKLEELFKKLSEGGTVIMPLEATYWAVKFGMCKDKFGINWLMNCELKK